MIRIYADDQLIYQPDDHSLILTQATLDTEAGKASALNITIPPGNVMYNGLTPLATKIQVHRDNDVIFRGRVLTTEREFYGMKNVYCEGELAYLNDSIQRPYKFNDLPHLLLEQYITSHNEQVQPAKQFTLGNYVDAFPAYDPSKIIPERYVRVTTANLVLYTTLDEETQRIVGTIAAGTEIPNVTQVTGGYRVTGKSTAGVTITGYTKQALWQTKRIDKINPYAYKVDASGAYTQTLQAINTNIVNKYGGYLVVRHENGVRYLDYVSEFTAECGQSVVFGSNLLDLTEHISAQDVYTIIIPLGKKSSGKPTTIKVKDTDPDYIESETGISLFGRITRTKEFDSKQDLDDLVGAGTRELQNAFKAALTINVNAVDLQLLGIADDAIREEMQVRVISEPHGIDDLFLCSAVHYDLLHPERTTYTLGREDKTLTDKTINSTARLNTMGTTLDITAGAVEDMSK